jgi:DNA-binding XRE family transcriptional regulator
MAITLKALRVNAGYDQKTAAQLIGVTPETLGNWEKGRSFPAVPHITKIEELYGVEYADINFSPVKVGLTEPRN